jgi:hypothetical protein
VDALMLIEGIDAHGHVQSRLRIAGAGSRCRIGRDLRADFVIDDEHAAAAHTELELREDGRVRVRDLGTRNGTRLDGERIPVDAGVVIEQGELLVGRTRLRVRTLHAALPPEKPFRRDALLGHRTALAVGGTATCVGYAVFRQWLEAPVSLATAAATVVLLTLAGLALWTGLWATASKLNHGAWQVRVHLAIAACGAGLCSWLWWLAEIAAFATQWRWLGAAVAAIITTAVLVALYLHLRKATPFPPRAAVALATSGTIALAGAAWLLELRTDVRDVNRVVPGPAIQPAAMRVAPSRDLADYLTEVDALRRDASRLRQESLLEGRADD